ncbi:RING-H2 finger protein ATL39-like [Durio zibethinus]|uniref:RING-H2 finger protein ATL39-like n=1 Tax=Durio zibethinus TaxID=66656 RepID=A0A6P5ZMN2_DURZI|nr:RING-H2 finger protein ATL39-like [Durio zibethinus]
MGCELVGSRGSIERKFDIGERRLGKLGFAGLCGMGCELVGVGSIERKASAWCLFNIIFECLGLFLSRFQNHDSEGDIELGETSYGTTPRRIHVLPAVCETRLSIPGPKKLISCAAGDECVICLESFQEKDVCCVLVNCDHVFHKPCVEEWLKINFSCPLCRTDAFSIIIDV